MNNLWLKFGCFLTGYNYQIISKCSEISRKAVKRYTAAMVIMCILWGLIGYAFVNRYFHANWTYSLLASLLFIIVIIQIERQIIMQTHRNNYLQFFRGWIALMMALIGSLIIDQIIFKDDIELEKEQFLNDKVNRIYPDRAQERKNQINELDSMLSKKEVDRDILIKDISNNPTINITSISVNPMQVSTTTRDSSRTITKTDLKNAKSTSTTQIQNPKFAMIAPLDSQINMIRTLKIAKEDSLTNLRRSLELKLNEKTGFLDELNIMWSLLRRSVPASIVYAVWFLLLLGLEMFILMNKRHEDENDYDHMIKKQKELHIRKLDLLGASSNLET